MKSASTPPPKGGRGKRPAVVVPGRLTPPPPTVDPAVVRMREIIERDRERQAQRDDAGTSFLSTFDAGAASLGLSQRRFDGDARALARSTGGFVTSQPTALPGSVSTVRAQDVEAERRGLSGAVADRMALAMLRVGDLDDAAAVRRNEQLFPTKGLTPVQLPAVGKQPGGATDGDATTTAEPDGGGGEVTATPKKKTKAEAAQSASAAASAALPPISSAYARIVGTTRSQHRAIVESADAERRRRKEAKRQNASLSLSAPPSPASPSVPSALRSPQPSSMLSAMRAPRQVRFDGCEELQAEPTDVFEDRQRRRLGDLHGVNDHVSPSALQAAVHRHRQAVELEEHRRDGLFLSDRARKVTDPLRRPIEFKLPEEMVRLAADADESGTPAANARALKRRYVRKLNRKYTLRRQERDLKSMTVLAETGSADVADDDMDDDEDGSLGGGGMPIRQFTVHVHLHNHETFGGGAATLTVDDVFALLGEGYSKDHITVLIESTGPADRFVDFKNKRLTKPTVAARACLAFIHAANEPSLPTPRASVTSSCLLLPRSGPDADNDLDRSHQNGGALSGNDEKDASSAARAAAFLGHRLSMQSSALLSESTFSVTSTGERRQRPPPQRPAKAVRSDIAWAKVSAGHEVVQVGMAEEYPRAYDRDLCHELELCTEETAIDEAKAKKLRAKQKRQRDRKLLEKQAELEVTRQQQQADLQKSSPANVVMWSPASLQDASDGAAAPGFSLDAGTVERSLLPGAAVGLSTSAPPAPTAAVRATSSTTKQPTVSAATAYERRLKEQQRAKEATSSDDGDVSDDEDAREERREQLLEQRARMEAEAAAAAAAIDSDDDELFTDATNVLGGGEGSRSRSESTRPGGDAAAAGGARIAAVGNFAFKAKKTFATHNAAAQRRIAAAKAAAEEEEDARQLAAATGLDKGAAAVQLDTESESESDDSDAAKSPSVSSEESGGSDAAADDEPMTPRRRTALLFAKYLVDPIPEPWPDFVPSEHQRETSNLKCALCIYSRPQLFCRACGYLMCKQCCAFVHKDVGLGAPTPPSGLKPVDVAEASSEQQRAGNDAEEDSAKDTTEADTAPKPPSHEPLYLSDYAKKVAKERYEKALQEEREVQAQRELEEQLLREEQLRRNPMRAFNLMNEGKDAAMAAGERAWSGGDQFEGVMRGRPRGPDDTSVSSSKHSRLTGHRTGRSNTSDGSGVRTSRSSRTNASSREDNEEDDEETESDGDGQLFDAESGLYATTGDKALRIDVSAMAATGALPGGGAGSPAPKVNRTASKKPRRRRNPIPGAATAGDSGPPSVRIGTAASHTDDGSPASLPLAPGSHQGSRATTAGSPHQGQLEVVPGDDAEGANTGGAGLEFSPLAAGQPYVPRKMPSAMNASLLGSIMTLKRKATQANAKGLRQLSKTGAAGDKAGKGAKASKAAAAALGSASPAPDASAVPEMVFESEHGDFVDAVQEPIPERLLAYARNRVGEAVSEGSMRLALLIVVDTFLDPNIAPLDGAAKQGDAWESALEASGYNVVRTAASNDHSGARPFLLPTIFNIAMLSRAFAATIDLDDFTFVIGIVTKGTYAVAPGTTQRKYMAFAHDSSALALSPAGVISPEMLAQPDCAGNCPIVVVDAAPISYLPTSGGGDATGFMWMSGRAGACATLAVRYAGLHAAWMAYYLERAERGLALPVRDGDATDVTQADFAAYVARKLAVRGASGIDVTPGMVGDDDATVDGNTFSTEGKVPDQSAVAFEGCTRTVGEQRLMPVLQLPQPVTNEIFRVAKKAEKASQCRAWITAWVLVSERNDGPNAHLAPAQWAAGFAPVLRGAVTGASAASMGRRSNAAPLSKRAGGGGKAGAKDELPRVSFVAAPFTSWRRKAVHTCRVFLGDFAATCLRDKSRRERAFEQVTRLAASAIEAVAAQAPNSRPASDVATSTPPAEALSPLKAVATPAVVRLYLADGFIEVGFAAAAELESFVAMVVPRPPKDASSPKAGAPVLGRRGAQGRGLSPVSPSAAVGGAASALAGFKPVAVGISMVIAVDGSEADARQLRKLQCSSQLRRYVFISDVSIAKDAPLEAHAAATTIQARTRGMRTRKQFRGLVNVVVAEVRHRLEARSARSEHIDRIFAAFQTETVKAAVAEEHGERKHLYFAERRSFLKVCEVRLVEIRSREVLFRDAMEQAEERARFEVEETIARVAVLFNSRVSWNGVLHWHRHDFRMLWDRFYVALAAHQELLEIVNTMRTTEGGFALSPDVIQPMPPPPTDYDFASTFVAFPREVRLYAESLTRDRNLSV